LRTLKIGRDDFAAREAVPIAASSNGRMPSLDPDKAGGNSESANFQMQQPVKPAKLWTCSNTTV
jgi:hypothetical protein